MPIDQVLREELRQDLRIRRREKDPLHPRAWIYFKASDTTAQVLTQGQQGRRSQVCQVRAVSGKSTPCADQNAQAIIGR